MIPKISIITITFNAERYLTQAIESVGEQRYPNLEYIIVDGGSTDGTLSIVKSYPDLVTRWISEPDNGISDAFNKGIRMASGEIIGIINADDGYLPGALPAVAQAVQDHPDFEVYYGNAIHERFDGSGVYQFRPVPKIGPEIWRRMPVSHPATFVRRSAYERFGVFDTRCPLAMDYELLLRFYRSGARFLYMDSLLARFRYGQDRGLGVLKEIRDSRIRNGQSSFTANIQYCQNLLREKVKALLPAFAQHRLKELFRKPAAVR